MSRIRIIIVWTLLGVIVLFSLGLYTGYRLFGATSQVTKVSAQAILTALHDRGFLVSQTYIFDTPVTIDRSTGSLLKDFFFGQTITARGTMEVNLGIDLAQVGEEDVRVSDDGNSIIVTIPRAKLFNTRLVGPIELQNRQGVLKRILDSDDGYNEALSLLAKTAEETAQKPELVDRATDHAKDDVQRILGYVAEGKSVVVEVR